MSPAQIAVLGFAAVQVFQALGAGRTSAASATVLASTGPVWIALLAPLVLHERPTVTTFGGVLLALFGVAAITGIDSPEPQGAFIVLASSVAYALYTVMGKQLAQRRSPLQFCAISCLGGAVATLPFAIWEIPARASLGPRPRAGHCWPTWPSSSRSSASPSGSGACARCLPPVRVRSSSCSRCPAWLWPCTCSGIGRRRRSRLAVCSCWSA